MTLNTCTHPGQTISTISGLHGDCPDSLTVFSSSLFPFSLISLQLTLCDQLVTKGICVFSNVGCRPYLLPHSYEQSSKQLSLQIPFVLIALTVNNKTLLFKSPSLVIQCIVQDSESQQHTGNLQINQIVRKQKKNEISLSPNFPPSPLPLSLPI